MCLGSPQALHLPGLCLWSWPNTAFPCGSGMGGLRGGRNLVERCGFAKILFQPTAPDPGPLVSPSPAAPCPGSTLAFQPHSWSCTNPENRERSWAWTKTPLQECQEGAAPVWQVKLPNPTQSLLCPFPHQEHEGWDVAHPAGFSSLEPWEP